MFVGVLSGAALEARAVDAVSLCGTEPLPDGRVVRVIDGRSVVLDDGRDIRLAGIEVPSPGAPAADALPSPGDNARIALETLLIGQAVTLRRATAEPDRYGRQPAYVYLAGVSAAHLMLERGHARLAAHHADGRCAEELRSRERVARLARTGLWAEPRYAIIDAGNLTELVSGQGRFAVVEGKVLSVRERGGTIYANFGRRWSQALTVTISKRQERIFAGAGLEPKRLENRQVLVRGWIEVRNGPRIEATRPEQIELIGRN